MATPGYVTEEDIELYTYVLREIKSRMDAAGSVLHGGTPRTRFFADMAAAELRIVLELLLLGSLVTNRSEVETVSTAFHNRDHDAAKKIVERVNPGYWPHPTKQMSEGPGRFRLEDVTEGFLHSGDWGPAYGFLSDQLHASNPYKKKPLSSEPLEPDLCAHA